MSYHISLPSIPIDLYFSEVSCVLCILKFPVANTFIRKVLFQNQCLWSLEKLTNLQASQMGINDRMLRWIQNFQSSRTARCHVQDTIVPTFTIRVGLPQGSVLVLFNTYTKDRYENFGTEKEETYCNSVNFK